MELRKGVILDVVNPRGLVWRNGRAKEEAENHANFSKNTRELEMWIRETATSERVCTAWMVDRTTWEETAERARLSWLQPGEALRLWGQVVEVDRKVS